MLALLENSERDFDAAVSARQAADRRSAWAEAIAASPVFTHAPDGLRAPPPWPLDLLGNSEAQPGADLNDAIGSEARPLSS